jgi:hypothetical protein
VVAFLLLLVVALVMKYFSMDTLLSGASAVFKEGLRGSVEDKMHEDLVEAANDQEEELPWYRDAIFWRKVEIKLKIVLSVYQIQNSTPWTLSFVKFPKVFEVLTKWTSVFELDIFRVLPLDCIFGRFSYYDKLVATTILPIILALLICAVGIIATYRARTSVQILDARRGKSPRPYVIEPAETT